MERNTTILLNLAHPLALPSRADGSSKPIGNQARRERERSKEENT
jgi:hypothetical protein